MATSAGQLLVAGRIPGEEIAVTEVTADSAGFTTTAIELASVTAPVVNGRTYWVIYDMAVQSSVAGDVARLSIHEDTISGTELQIRHHPLPDTAATASNSISRARFTATATANKTFALRGVRQDGTGTLNVNAASNFPSFMWVEYVEG